MSKRTLRGRLIRADIGTGAWVLEADDGVRWQLAGDVPAALAGRQVTVEGAEAALFGFSMSGPTFQVASVRPS